MSSNSKVTIAAAVVKYSDNKTRKKVKLVYCLFWKRKRGIFCEIEFISNLYKAENIIYLSSFLTWYRLTDSH